MSQPTGQPQGGPPSWQQPPQQPAPPAPPPPAQSWQQPPQQPMAPMPPGRSQPPSWTASLTSTSPVAGPAGYVYGDIPNRSIAYIIDFILLLIIGVVVGAISIAILGDRLTTGTLETTSASLASQLVYSIVWFGIIAAYFWLTWTRMRGTVGMKLLGMQIGHETDGRTIDDQAAFVRIAAMFGPGFVANVVSAFALGLGFLANLIAIVWFFALLYTTAKSPTKQGLHDQYAHTMVVKAARRAA
jgi:uncharacterized RDD family membrane protein YckC